MIGKSAWFSRRKYTGWGLTPKTWQGWAYIVAIIAPFIIVAETHAFGTIQIAFLAVWGAVFFADLIDIMMHMAKDERDRIHEAIAERNAMWALVTVLALGIIYQSVLSAASQGMRVDPVILVALLVAVAVKMVSNIYLDKRD